MAGQVQLARQLQLVPADQPLTLQGSLERSPGLVVGGPCLRGTYSGVDQLEEARRAGEADLVVLDLASTPAIEQAVRRAGNLWEALFPTVMMGDDRAVKAVWIAGRPLT